MINITSRHNHCSGIKDSLCDPTPAPTTTPDDELNSPSTNPIDTPSSNPSTKPSDEPSGEPSTGPSMQPSTYPSNPPTFTMSHNPSITPSTIPSPTPSMKPTKSPSIKPSFTPTHSPTTSSPTYKPSAYPSISFIPTYRNYPSDSPSKSHSPSLLPSVIPSVVPSSNPSYLPSSYPSRGPSVMPSKVPSTIPTYQASQVPSIRPSVHPSIMPTQKPTPPPTLLPSNQPTINLSSHPSYIPTTSFSSSPPPDDQLVDDNDASKRFIFVDLKDGYWSTYQSDIYKQNPILHCPIGSSIVFHYPNGYHDVVAMANEDHYNNCNFDNSTILAPLVQNPNMESVTYYHNCTTPGQMEYISCSVPGHCTYGQKIQIQTSDNITTRDEVSGEWLIHVQSLDRILRLLGRRYEESTGFLVLDRGYQTEEVAQQTLEWIWCGLDHCPSFYDLSSSSSSTSSSGTNTSTDAAYTDCEGAIYTLMGFVSRKRPLPQYEKAKEYYTKAINGGGTNECAARSYLTELYLDQLDFVNATKAANQLCEACGNGHVDDLYGSSVRQAKYAIDSLSNDLIMWPTAGPCAAADGNSPSLSTNLVPTPYPSLEVRSTGYYAHPSSFCIMYSIIVLFVTVF